MEPLPTTTTAPRGDPDNLSCASRKTWGCFLQPNSQDVVGLRDHYLLTHQAEPQAARQGSQALASTTGVVPALLSCSQEGLGAAAASGVSMGVPGATAPTVSQPSPQCSNGQAGKEEKPRDGQSRNRLSLGTSREWLLPSHAQLGTLSSPCTTAEQGQPVSTPASVLPPTPLWSGTRRSSSAEPAGHTWPNGSLGLERVSGFAEHLLQMFRM